MSADNSILIRKHPWGGYAIVHESASDPNWGDTLPRPEDWQFDSVEDALDIADQTYTEYGVSVHPECEVPAPDRSDSV